MGSSPSSPPQAEHLGRKDFDGRGETLPVPNQYCVLIKIETSPPDRSITVWPKVVRRIGVISLEQSAILESSLSQSPGDVAKYADIASFVGMAIGAVGKAAHDLRQQFVQELRTEVRNTVAEDDVEEELRYLTSLWGKASRRSALASSSLNYSRKISVVHCNLLVYSVLWIQKRAIRIRKRIFLSVRKMNSSRCQRLRFSAESGT
ncbi:MAG: hypothetical protein ACI957_005292 [Verrucomicrobiales bacterium]|jgi:hypothetical protein